MVNFDFNLLRTSFQFAKDSYESLVSLEKTRNAFFNLKKIINSFCKIKSEGIVFVKYH